MDPWHQSWSTLHSLHQSCSPWWPYQGGEHEPWMQRGKMAKCHLRHHSWCPRTLKDKNRSNKHLIILYTTRYFTSMLHEWGTYIWINFKIIFCLNTQTRYKEVAKSLSVKNCKKIQETLKRIFRGVSNWQLKKEQSSCLSQERSVVRIQ